MINRALCIIKNYWPSMAVVAVILYATLAEHPVPDNDLPLIPHIDKLIHVIMMGGLTGALAFDYQRARRAASVLTVRVMLTIALGVLIFSAVDEILQSALTAERSGDPLDLLADAVGILVALPTAPPVIRRILHVNS